MSLLTELGIFVKRKKQVCRAYGGQLLRDKPKASVRVPEYQQVVEI